jgi:hypothetical protein
MFTYDIPLTKQEILERISQESIFEKYLGIYPQTDGRRYINPLRENKTPNTEFLYIRNTLYMRDWGGNDKNLNCFSIVQLLYNCSYNEALKHIENDFGLGSQPINTNIPTIQRNSNYNHVEVPVKKLTSIQIRKKEFTEKELNFWNCNNNFNFTTEELEKHQIYSTEYVWYNENKIKSKEGVFAYQLKPQIFQIYSPFCEDRKYRFRSTDLKGILVNAHLLKPSKTVLLTKSFKDEFYSRVLRANSTALLNEGIIPTRQQIDFLKTKGRIVLLYDNDEKGIAVANRICDEYKEVSKIFLPVDYGKDVDESIRNVGKKKVLYWMDKNGLLE